MKRFLCIAMILSLMITVIGCGSDKDVVDNNEIPVQQKEVKQSPEEKPEQQEPEKIVVEGVKSPLSGIIVPEEKINRRPVTVMFDNHRAARWQAGLSQAEIAYEMLVEGRITRYLGVFLVNEPKVIGSVRSARPYFISAALEYDPLYVRCGGSEQAKADVKKLKVADIDGLYSGAFYRNYKTGKKNEHTLYTSMEKIRKEQKRRKYRETANFTPFLFNNEDIDIITDTSFSAKEVFIDYKLKNTTKYIYDSKNKVYNRYKDGKQHIDETNKAPIVAKNIIVQKASTKAIDSYGRLSIATVGKGSGYYITNGKGINITWKKSDRKAKTKYFDEDGKEIILNPGVTWIQVVEAKPIVKFDTNN
ncbi:DUF3048 domain-containing protein [Clostridiaceae bacterium M8S5]|nr:DUF3048 domain-containing protein [Clostridiaceae bacterium M8S5]